jgi:hypothetical protein
MFELLIRFSIGSTVVSLLLIAVNFKRIVNILSLKNNPQIIAILVECDELIENHPSKDCRFFAKRVKETLKKY